MSRVMNIESNFVNALAQGYISYRNQTLVLQSQTNDWFVYGMQTGLWEVKKIIYFTNCN